MGATLRYFIGTKLANGGDRIAMNRSTWPLPKSRWWRNREYLSRLWCLITNRKWLSTSVPRCPVGCRLEFCQSGLDYEVQAKAFGYDKIGTVCFLQSPRGGSGGYHERISFSNPSKPTSRSSGHRVYRSWRRGGNRWMTWSWRTFRIRRWCRKKCIPYIRKIIRVVGRRIFISLRTFMARSMIECHNIREKFMPSHIIFSSHVLKIKDPYN